MQKSSDPRHLARWYALQKLFNLDFLDSKEESDFSFDSSAIKEINEIEDFKIDQKLADKIVVGVLENKDKMNKIITDIAPERPIEQISKLDLQILYMAIYEGFLGKVTPEKVVIDEAIELTKEFGTEVNRKFVNGVLGNLIINSKKYEKILNG